MEGTKKCPYCGQEIKASAKKCHYCGHWLDDGSMIPETNFFPSNKSSSGIKPLSIIVATLGVVALLLIIVTVARYSNNNSNGKGNTVNHPVKTEQVNEASSSEEPAVEQDPVLSTETEQNIVDDLTNQLQQQGASIDDTQHDPATWNGDGWDLTVYVHATGGETHTLVVKISSDKTQWKLYSFDGSVY